MLKTILKIIFKIIYLKYKIKRLTLKRKILKKFKSGTHQGQKKVAIAAENSRSVKILKTAWADFCPRRDPLNPTY